MVIDDYRWYAIGKAEQEVVQAFSQELAAGAIIGILSEAGCPGVADPGQVLVARAQQEGAVVKPLTGPSSILLALMASGLNGQQFCFNGYLPIDSAARRRRLQQLDEQVRQQQTTQIFIETPYRNDQMAKEILQACHPGTRLCIAADLTGPGEFIRTLTVADWKKTGLPPLHKRPCIFLIG
jgi:16S rRNA (cytidine1402-2'-O)-methyltransferase